MLHVTQLCRENRSQRVHLHRYFCSGIRRRLLIMPEEGFLLQSKHILEINTSPGATDGTQTFERLAAGISSMEPSSNDELAQDRYFDGDGYGETDVIGAQLVLTFSGHRKYGDPAQDFIMGLMLDLGPGRRTDFRWTLPNGDVYEGPVTVANITGPSGEAGAKGEIGFEIHFNGKPEFTPPGSNDGGGGVEG